MKQVTGSALLFALLVIIVGGCDAQQTANDAGKAVGDAAQQVGTQVSGAVSQATSLKTKMGGLKAALSSVDAALNLNNADLANKAITTWDEQGWAKVEDEVKANSTTAYSNIETPMSAIIENIKLNKLDVAKQAVNDLRKAIDDFIATQP